MPCSLDASALSEWQKWASDDALNLQGGRNDFAQCYAPVDDENKMTDELPLASIKHQVLKQYSLQQDIAVHEL